MPNDSIQFNSNSKFISFSTEGIKDTLFNTIDD